MDVILLTARNEVDIYLNDVRSAADGERGAFGFLPKTAYEEFSAQGRMIVAVDSRDRTMLGYVLYGGAMPQGKIFQTYARPIARGCGVGRQLVSEVVKRLERQHYLSLRADVAQELDAANEFYAALEFEVVTVRPGKTRGRLINVRVRELETPSLIEMAANADPYVRLPINLPVNERMPLYVLDLNILFDVAHGRSKAPYSSSIFGAGLEAELRIAVSAELLIELQRNSDPATHDPILRFAESLPRLPAPPKIALDSLAKKLAPIVFPERSGAGHLSIQDQSDLKHVATAIHESATGFITSEKAILRAAESIRGMYGLEVLSPEALGVSTGANIIEHASLDIWSSGVDVRTQILAKDDDYNDVETFLIQQSLTATERRAMLAAGTATLPRRRHIVRVSGKVIAFAAWDAPSALGRTRILHALVDESNPAASLASDHLIERAIADVGGAPPCIFELASKAGQSSVRQAARTRGFFQVQRGRSQSQTLQKVALGRIVVPEDWKSLRDAVQMKAGIELPEQLPRFSDICSLGSTNADGDCVALPLGDLERLFAPLLLVLPDRPAVVFPITQRYAEELFSGSAQPTFLSGHEAALRSVRGYISAHGSYGIVPEGGLALFYESSRGGGRMAITALARITRKYLMSKESASQALDKKAVLDAQTVRGMGRGMQVAVTEFEDLMLLKKPVPLAKLRQLGCVSGSNFVTATAIASQHAIEIATAGAYCA